MWYCHRGWNVYTVCSMNVGSLYAAVVMCVISDSSNGVINASLSRDIHILLYKLGFGEWIDGRSSACILEAGCVDDRCTIACLRVLVGFHNVCFIIVRQHYWQEMPSNQLFLESVPDSYTSRNVVYCHPSVCCYILTIYNSASAYIATGYRMLIGKYM